MRSVLLVIAFAITLAVASSTPLVPRASAQEVLSADEERLFVAVEDGLFGSDGDTFPSGEDELFETDDEALFGSDEDDLFGGGRGGLLQEVDSSNGDGVSLVDELLVRDRPEVGLTYRLALQSDWVWPRVTPSSPVRVPEHRLGLQLNGSIFVDARPRPDFRLFAKARAEANPSTPLLQLHELFADFNLDERVFFRGGKQQISWGVGYFFSPADIVNIGRLDPENPEADREGPVALKVNLPVGSNNYYVHLIADRDGATSHLAVAPKAEVVLGGSEWGLGAYVRERKAPRGMVTLSSSWGPISLFGEGVLSYGSDKRFVQEATGPGSPALAVVRRTDEPFAHATFGARLAVTDPQGRYSVSAAAQYAFNGEGYPPGFLAENGDEIQALVNSGALSPADLRNSGRHYAALSLGWTKALNSRYSPNLFWMGNLQDGSGMATATLGVDLWQEIDASIGLRRTYGPIGGEFAPGGGETTLFFRVSLGSDRAY